MPLVLMGSQIEFMDQVFGPKGIAGGIHEFVALKGRQMGISTISVAIDLFWLFMHPATQGAIITHNDEGRDNFRHIMTRYLENLPASHKIGIRTHNRYQLVLSNGSVVNYLVAGTKKGGTLGRGLGLNFIHATECSSWGDQEGLQSLLASLAEKNPERLYIFESTARGRNMFFEMYDSASEIETRHAFFLGWWLKEDYAYARGSPVFERYWDGQLTETEQERCQKVKDQHGHIITPEQIAWYRLQEKKAVSLDLLQQEFPWTADEAFIQSGRSFFPNRILMDSHDLARKKKFMAFRYSLGEDFFATNMEQLYEKQIAFAQLRIWEEPDPEGVYVIGVDPAYGQNEDSDRSCICVLRCYADKVVQVAEFSSTYVQTNQLAWIVMHLGGSYKSAMINMEITGPGMAVWQEVMHLRQLVTSGQLAERAKDAGVSDMFGSIRWYLYRKWDSPTMPMGVYHWKTNYENKRRILNQVKDSISIRHLELSSVKLVEEMATMVQEGSTIQGDGRAKDDRVMALALAHSCWTDYTRREMISQGRTFAVEQQRMAGREEKQRSMGDMNAVVFRDFFVKKQVQRIQTQRYNRMRKRR